jgi:tetratricopeptide (TPR) repeat protein
VNPRRRPIAVVVALACVLGPASGVSLAATPAGHRSANPDVALELARAALAEFQAGHYAQSADLYRQAWQADPSHPGYLFGVGRAEQKAGHWQAAIFAYEQLLALVPASDPVARRAHHALMIVKNAARVAVPEPDAASPPPVVLPAPATPGFVDMPLAATPATLSAEPTLALAPPLPVVPQVVARQPADTRASAWVAVGLDIACLLGAGALGWNARQADRDADRYRLAGSQLFDPLKISESAAATRIDAINTDRGLAIGLALTAVVVTAASAWLFRSHRAPTAVTKAGP